MTPTIANGTAVIITDSNLYRGSEGIVEHRYNNCHQPYSIRLTKFVFRGIEKANPGYGFGTICIYGGEFEPIGGEG